MEIEFKCPMCNSITKLKMTKEELQRYESGDSVHKIFTDRSLFFCETMISHICFNCQSTIFNRPKSGENWGINIGECDNCGSSLWQKDIKDGKVKCNMCGMVNKI